MGVYMYPQYSPLDGCGVLQAHRDTHGWRVTLYVLLSIHMSPWRDINENDLLISSCFENFKAVQGTQL